MGLLWHYFACILIFSSAFAWGAPATSERYQYIEPDSISYLDGKLALRYLTTCNKPQHTILAQYSSDRTLSIGVLSRHLGSSCASMPRLVTEVLDYLDLGEIKKIRKIPQRQMRGLLRVVVAEDIRLVPRTANRASLDAVYQSRCGDYRGMMIKASAHDSLQMAFVEARRGRGKQRSCVFHQKLKKLPLMQSTSLGKVKVSKMMDWSVPSRAYDLRLAKVDSKNLMVSDGRLQFSYKRGCNEVPVGVAMSEYRGAHAPITVGMVVARFYNRSCEYGDKKSQWYQHRSPKFNIHEGTKLRAMAATRRFAQIKLHPVVNYVSHSGKLRVNYLGGCDSKRAVVYGYGDQQKRSMAVMVPNSKFTCKKPIKKVSLMQPGAFSEEETKPRYYPLQLLGAMY